MEKRTIFLIEDNELNMKRMRAVLTNSGYQVVEAVDAETGLVKAQKQLPGVTAI